MNRNKMGYKEYIVNTIYLNVIFLWIYYFSLFSPMTGYSKLQSFLLLIIMVVMGVMLDLVVVGRHARNWKNIIVTMLLVPGGYTFYTQFHDRNVWYKWVLTPAGVIWGCYLILLFARKINGQADRRKVLLSRIRRAYLGAKCLGACIGTIIFIIAFIYTFFPAIITTGCIFSEEAMGYSEEDSLAANIEQVLKLQPEEYSKLTIDEKMELLQVMADIQGRYLGLARRVIVRNSSLKEGEVANYSDATAVIQIDTEHLSEEPQEVLETLYHEMFHAAQHQYAEIYNQVSAKNKNSYFLMDAETYAYEIANYKSGEDDVLEYYSQKLEQDARAHGIIDAQQVYDRIEEYLTETKNSEKNILQEDSHAGEEDSFVEEEPLISREVFSRGDTVMQIEEYEYDMQKRKTAEKIYQLDQDTEEMKLSFRYDYSYDDAFCYKDTTYVNEDNTVTRTILDAKGNEIYVQELLSGGIHSQTYAYKYSMDTERRKETYCYEGEAKAFSSYDAVLYNQRGNPTFLLTQMPNNDIFICKIEYEYNENNEIIRETKIYREGEERNPADDLIVEKSCTYRPDGLLEKETWTSRSMNSEKVEKTIWHQYDDQGREIRREEQDLADEDTIWVTEFTYIL